MKIFDNSYQLSFYTAIDKILVDPLFIGLPADGAGCRFVDDESKRIVGGDRFWRSSGRLPIVCCMYRRIRSQPPPSSS